MPQRINIIATFEIPDGEKERAQFRRLTERTIKAMEMVLGSDCVLEYLALETKQLDTIVRD